MKRKAIIGLDPTLPGRDGEIFTVQVLDKILIMNYWKDQVLIGRYCLDTNSGEYASYLVRDGAWKQYKLRTLCSGDCYYCRSDWYKMMEFGSKNDEELAVEMLISPKQRRWEEEIFTVIDMKETDYCQEKRDAKEWRRKQRIETLMKPIPELSEKARQWILDTAGVTDYLFYRKEKDTWFCSLCRKESREADVAGALAGQEVLLCREDKGRASGGAGAGKRSVRKAIRKIRHNDQVICPVCRKTLQAKKKGEPEVKGRVMVLQEVGDKMSVARHFDFCITWQEGKHLSLSEAARIMLSKEADKGNKIYWNQSGRKTEIEGYERYKRTAEFDDKHNPAGRIVRESLLYPEGILPALTGTINEEWGKLFAQMAGAGLVLDYSRLMTTSGRGLSGMVEYLFKGRFTALLREVTGGIWCGDYFGKLNHKGKTEREVFMIDDKQKINRIRQRNGGMNMVGWMRWSEKNQVSINDETLDWLEKEKVKTRDFDFILGGFRPPDPTQIDAGPMSPRQVMNYIKKQQVSEYPRMKVTRILEQWKDYLSMCKETGRDISDEMVYRPRQLKRRHQEVVEEIRKKRMLEEMKRSQEQQKAYAEEMAGKFPGAEENLRQVKEKLAYDNGEYRIIVPERLVDIIAEGNALHHCAGATERYFERIKSRETYICFLRRSNEPEVPFYTIEVEPGGTIRQHRSMYDEEPGIEEIRGFLKEWQKVIKQRMSREDKELAKESAIKRQQNLEELRQRNNLRVLEGLMQDFMEAM